MTTSQQGDGAAPIHTLQHLNAEGLVLRAFLPNPAKVVPMLPRNLVAPQRVKARLFRDDVDVRHFFSFVLSNPLNLARLLYRVAFNHILCSLSARTSPAAHKSIGHCNKVSHLEYPLCVCDVRAATVGSHSVNHGAAVAKGRGVFLRSFHCGKVLNRAAGSASACGAKAGGVIKAVLFVACHLVGSFQSIYTNDITRPTFGRKVFFASRGMNYGQG